MQSCSLILYPAIVIFTDAATSFALGSMAAFGTPVVPEVKI